MLLPRSSSCSPSAALSHFLQHICQSSSCTFHKHLHHHAEGPVLTSGSNAPPPTPSESGTAKHSSHHASTLANLDLHPISTLAALASALGQSGFNQLVGMCDSLAQLGFDPARNTLVTQLVVGDMHLNTRGTLHGGMIVTLVDAVTSTAICEAGHPTGGMSVELGVSSVKAGPSGSTVVVMAEVERIGANLAFARCWLFTSVEEGRCLVASGKHTKFVGILLSGGLEAGWVSLRD